MKKIILSLVVILLSFSSCENECKTCTIQVFYDGVEKENLETVEIYCGEALDAIESESRTSTVGSIQRTRTCVSY